MRSMESKNVMGMNIGSRMAGLYDRTRRNWIFSDHERAKVGTQYYRNIGSPTDDGDDLLS